MARANFYLKNPKAKDESLIYLFFSFNDRRLKYSTGEKINPEFWNSENQRAKETKKFPEYPEFNSRLDNYETAIKNIYRKLLNEGKNPDSELLKFELDKEFKNVSPERVLTLFEFIDKYIEESKYLKMTGTIKTYTYFFNHLKNYSEKICHKVNFNDIDLEFYNSFVAYLKSDINLSDNTIGKNIKILKTILNEATDRGLNENLEFRKKKFKKLSEESDKIYLKTSELEKIYELDYSNDKKLDRVRDLFIIGCYTGLRFSDFIQLSPDNIIDDNKIKIRTQKTNETVIIPIHKNVRSILKKYEGKIPEAISNQNMNEYLKLIGRKAEIFDKIEISSKKGGTQNKEVIEKCDLISTHTARRSFATNLYLADVPAITIMKITGHKTEKSFLRYIRISQEENANKLLNHPFFN